MEGGCIVAVDMVKDSLIVEVWWAGDWSICSAVLGQSPAMA